MSESVGRDIKICKTKAKVCMTFDRAHVTTEQVTVRRIHSKPVGISCQNHQTEVKELKATWLFMTKLQIGYTTEGTFCVMSYFLHASTQMPSLVRTKRSISRR